MSSTSPIFIVLLGHTYWHRILGVECPRRCCQEEEASHFVRIMIHVNYNTISTTHIHTYQKETTLPKGSQSVHLSIISPPKPQNLPDPTLPLLTSIRILCLLTAKFPSAIILLYSINSAFCSAHFSSCIAASALPSFLCLMQYQANATAAISAAEPIPAPMPIFAPVERPDHSFSILEVVLSEVVLEEEEEEVLSVSRSFIAL